MVTGMYGFKEKRGGTCPRCTEGELQGDHSPSCNSKTTNMNQPIGFEIHDWEHHIYRLMKALYDLKQTPRAWYERIDSNLMKLRFTRSEDDPNHCFKVLDDKPLILVPYEDDLFLTGADPLI